RRRFTHALDFQGTFKSALVSRASGAPARIGFDRHSVKEWSHLFHTVHVPLPDGPVHRVERNLALTAPLGIGPEPGPIPVVLPISEKDRAAADAALERAGASGAP